MRRFPRLGSSRYSSLTSPLPPLHEPHPLSPSPHCGEGGTKWRKPFPLSTNVERGLGGEATNVERGVGGEPYPRNPSIQFGPPWPLAVRSAVVARASRFFGSIGV